MFKSIIDKNTVNEQDERNTLNNLSEKELLVEILLELKKINIKCDALVRIPY